MKATMRYVSLMLLLSALFLSCSDNGTKFFNKTQSQTEDLKPKERFVYCRHPESESYVEGPYPPKGYDEEFCEFVACDDGRFEGREKFEEFQAYLQDHPGELVVNNSSKYCGQQLIFKESVDISPNTEDAAFKGAEITFILDDSGSMENEISSVKSALLDLAPTMKNLKADIKMDFVRMSEINSRATAVGNPDYYGYKKYEYTLPKPIGTVKVHQNSNVEALRKQLNKVLDNFDISSGFSQEQGLCMTLRHLNDLTRKGFEEKMQYIGVLISDEDEDQANNSSNCVKSFKAKNFPSTQKDREVFQDNQGLKRHISSFTDHFQSLSPAQKDSYGWFGILYDQRTSACRSGYQHGQTYLDFAEALKDHGVSYQLGDICSSNYTSLIYDKLINGFLSKVGLEYKFFSHYKAPIINSVVILKKNGQEEKLSSDDFKIIEKGNDYFIRFDNSLKGTISESEKVTIKFTWNR